MDTAIERRREGSIPFSLSMEDYFMKGKYIYESIIRKRFIELAPYLIGNHRDLIHKVETLEELFKLDTITEMVDPCIKMEQIKEGYKRSLISDFNKIQFLSQGLNENYPTSILTWSLPFKNSREFSRFEMKVLHANSHKVITGMMDLFFDIPFEGADRFQVLVSYDGLLPNIRPESFNCYTVGGTFSENGNRLTPCTNEFI